MNQHPTLWTPSREFIENSNLKKYERWLGKNHRLHFSSYQELWKWSVSDVVAFWESLWNYFDIISHKSYKRVLSSKKMPGIKWFEGAEINYAEHIFRNRSEDHPALVFSSESGQKDSVSWSELEKKVASVREFLKSEGIGKGDRVAAYLPNIPEAVIAFLAVNSLGAVWSCCSPDFGVSTVIDRFSQVQPSILFAVTEHVYNGKHYSREKEVDDIVRGIKSIHKIVIISDSEGLFSENQSRKSWDEVISFNHGELSFTPVEFNHPIWVLYSSGTTGKPKAITHSHGGVLLEHLKYLHFHNDVKPGENFFWYTTTGWMMWNFLQASMLAGATAVLYDGSAAYPDLNKLWKLAEELPIHHFGTSAPYLEACMKNGLKPAENFDLTELRSIGSTGAPLSPEAFDWVYSSVSNNVWLCSMSGGTDMCTAFVGGCPYEPVRRGLIQQRCLGADLHAFDEAGDSIIGSLGEMVISKPMPSMPVFFWGDENFKRYRSSYFETYEEIWRHGDWVKLFEDGSLMIQGRSDATLNRKGIRIGTAEIYSIVNKVPGVKDSLIVNVETDNGGDYMPLFVQFNDGVDIKNIPHEIRKKLRSEGSPRHLPDEIIPVPDIPFTLSGKKMEVPVKKLLMGMDIGNEMNKDAMKNPEVIEFFIRFGKEKII